MPGYDQQDAASKLRTQGIEPRRAGNRLKVEGPFGDFVLQEKSGKRALMIATGTGVSPIKAMLLHLLDTRSTREVHLLFGVRHEADLFYTDLYRGLASRYPQFRYDITLSAPNPETWAGRQGRVTQLLEDVLRPGDAESTEVYLCGGQRMIEDCKARLREQGFGGIPAPRELVLGRVRRPGQGFSSRAA